MFFGKKNRKKLTVKHSMETLLISLICLQPFVQDCLRRQIFISKSRRLDFTFSKDFSTLKDVFALQIDI